MKLLLIRHGQSLSNLLWLQRGVRGTSEDSPLSPLGFEQAACLAAAFRDGVLPRPDQLLTSLMRRAVQTVAPVADALDLPVTGVLDVHEVGGVFLRHDDGTQVSIPGEPRAALEALCPRLVLPAEVTEAGWYFRPVESLADSWGRAQAVIARLTAQYAQTEDVVALVCHGMFMQLLLRVVLGCPPAFVLPHFDVWFEINNTATMMMQWPWAGAQARVIWTNRTDHLTPAQLTV